jgi:hypothetical protein
MKVNTSSTGTMEKLLMSQEERMLKDKQLSSGTNIMVLTRDGKSSMLTRPIRFQERDLMRNSDSTEIDHSISDPDFQ